MRAGRSRKTILVIVGMPGAGKSLASGVAKTLGIPVFVSGDIIRSEARRRKMTLTRENLGALMLRIRREEGMGAVARRLIPLIEKSERRHILYEGARNLEEINELKKRHRVVAIAIHASPGTRFQRLLRRRRSDRPRTMSDFQRRDDRELKVGIGRVIALADRVLENESSKDELKRSMKRLLEKTLA